MAMGANATELSELSAVGVQLSACRAGAFENPVVVQVFFDDAERSPGYHTFGSRAERRRQPSRRVRSGGSRLSARSGPESEIVKNPGCARTLSPASRPRAHTSSQLDAGVWGSFHSAGPTDGIGAVAGRKGQQAFDWRHCVVNLGERWQMSATVSVEEAASNFAELLARVTAGEEVVIASGGKPVARLSPVEKGLPRQRIPDLDKGKIWVAPDFDDPLPEFEKEFYGE